MQADGQSRQYLNCRASWRERNSRNLMHPIGEPRSSKDHLSRSGVAAKEVARARWGGSRPGGKEKPSGVAFSLLDSASPAPWRSSSKMSKAEDGRLKRKLPGSSKDVEAQLKLPLLIAAGSITFIGLKFVMSPKMVRRRVLGFTGSASFSGVSSSSSWVLLLAARAALPGTNSGVSHERAQKPFEAADGVAAAAVEALRAAALLIGEGAQKLPKAQWRPLASPVSKFRLSQTEAVVLPEAPRRIKVRQSNSAAAFGDAAAHAAAQAAEACAARAACAAMICAAMICASVGEHGTEAASQAPAGKNGDGEAP
mmetsp:Transcript_62072/g.202530  ORF Transcript_62072/g.202530 Transcript_62072/m.202530 type:complete len:311 (-) Transcript_62072:557-1489(-)